METKLNIVSPNFLCPNRLINFNFYFYLKISPCQRNTIETLLFKLFDKLIRLELAEYSQTSSTKQSFKYEINVNLSTSESLKAMFNILLKQIDNK